jgi:CBS domain containing-hemolysin-like protein
MIELLIAVGVVLAVSALCSLLEASFYSVPLSHIEHLAQSGKRSGKVLRSLRKHVDRPITAVLTLNTLANTGGAAIAGSIAAANIASEWGRYTFSGLFTLTILIFGEVIPKTTGVVYGKSIASLAALPLHVLVILFTPIIALCRLLTKLVAGEHPSHQVSVEEIITLARLGTHSGEIDADEALVIQNILSLENKTARDVMTPRTVVFSMKASLTVKEARQVKGFLDHSRIPVYDKDVDDVVGLVHGSDVLHALADDHAGVPLERLMKPVHFVLESMTLDRLLQMFLERKQHLFVVVDEFGGLSGVVTLEDVLEAILGKEIVDEFDQVTDMRELAHRRRRLAVEAKGK